VRQPISVSSQLPTIATNVTIDGYQSARPEHRPEWIQCDAVHLSERPGHRHQWAAHQRLQALTVRGLAIGNFSGSGIAWMSSGATGRGHQIGNAFGANARASTSPAPVRSRRWLLRQHASANLIGSNTNYVYIDTPTGKNTIAGTWSG
jgi:hypothetical protein